MKKTTRVIAGKMIVYLIVGIGALATALPFIWMISSSFKPLEELFIFPPQLIPRSPDFSNYSRIIPMMNFFVCLKNTLIISIGMVIGSVLSSSLVGYSFARLKWPGKNIFFVLLLSTMMIPFAVTMIPLFIIFKTLGWINTFKPLIVPSFCGSAFFVFLFRQFFSAIPEELSDAARIDGCGEFGIYWRIILPLAKSALVVVGIFAFARGWNAYLGPLIYLSDLSKWPLALSLRALTATDLMQVDWGEIMAGSTLMILPMIIIFFFAQKVFMEGITLTGLKG